MEHIGKALRKAADESGSARSIRPVTMPASGARSKRRSVGKIVYEKTRTVEVSRQTLERRRVIAGLSRHPQADAYRILRTQVLRRLEHDQGTSLGILSANSGDGKSLTAVNLAVSIAMVPTHTVLLVDLDLRRPSIHDYFGFAPEPGVSDYLLGKKAIADCLVHPGIERLTILSAGRGLKYSSEALASPRMLSLVNELKGRYRDRLVIFDLPPLLSSDDALVLLPHIDAHLLVVRDGKTQAGEAQRCLHMLESHTCIGTVLNNSAEVNPYPYY